MSEYDVIIVGAGIAGPALAHTLANDGRKVLIVDRDWREPDVFRGELLQPGGVRLLAQLGLADCITGIDEQVCHGYTVYKRLADDGDGKVRHECHTIPYPASPQSNTGPPSSGFSFHHGRFIQKLRGKLQDREKCVFYGEFFRCTKHYFDFYSITTLEANVVSLIESGDTVCGIRYTFKGEDAVHEATAPLTFDCSGSFSILRRSLTESSAVHSSHFVALLLHNVPMAVPNHGTVVLADPAPVLCYSIGTGELRVLVDVPDPLPSVSSGALRTYLLTKILPQLPDFMRGPFAAACDERLRSVPCRRLRTQALRREGGFALGDSLNMRHPLTGGGMTVALNDVSIVSALLRNVDLTDRAGTMRALTPFFSKRSTTAGTINILSQALYEVFCGGEERPPLQPMRDPIFAYFPHFGTDTLGLMSGLSPSPARLVMHFFTVAFIAFTMLMLPLPTIGRAQMAVSAFVAAALVIKPLILENLIISRQYRWSKSKSC